MAQRYYLIRFDGPASLDEAGHLSHFFLSSETPIHTSRVMQKGTAQVHNAELLQRGTRDRVWRTGQGAVEIAAQALRNELMRMWLDADAEMLRRLGLGEHPEEAQEAALKGVLTLFIHQFEVLSEWRSQLQEALQDGEPEKELRRVIQQLRTEALPDVLHHARDALLYDEETA